MNIESIDDDFLDKLEADLAALPEETPPLAARERFEAFISKEQEITDKTSQKESKVISLQKWLPWTGVAAAFIITLGTLMYNQHKQTQALSGSMMAMHKSMEKMLQNDSPTQRIKAISVSYDMGNTLDKDVLRTLIDVVRHDESSNVRQTAVEALSNYIDDANVRSALIKALPKEEDAAVKLSIIQTIAQKKDNTTKGILEELAHAQNQDPFVVQEANMQLSRFKQY